MTELRNLDEEVAMLEAIEGGHFDASGGVIRHRGRVVPRRELPQLIARVKRERDGILAAIERHDQECRTLHDAAARKVQYGWWDYLRSLTELLHYAEHSEADLNDAHGKLANITMMATASGRVNQEKLNRILASANDLQGVMSRLDQHAESIQLPEPIFQELETAGWREMLPKLELPPANEQNIGQWLEVVDSWVIPMVRSFGALRKAALAELLKAERTVAAMYLGEEEPRPAPPCATIPTKYKTRPRGSERDRQKKLDWWSRFTLADGWGPGLLRFAVASSIVAAVVLAGLYVGSANVIIYNGLSIPVNVSVSDQNVTVAPFQYAEVSVGAHRRCPIVARTTDGREIESFEAGVDKAFANYVYNVAGAAPLFEWTVIYGRASQREPRMLGFPRWSVTGAKDIFTQPPASADSGTSRLIFGSNVQTPPQYTLRTASDPAEREQAIRAHARWDTSKARFIEFWLAQASVLKDFDQIVATRFAADPGDVVTRRIEQDLAHSAGLLKVLEQHRQLASQHPDDPNWQYLGILRDARRPRAGRGLLEALQKWPDHPWLNYAVAYVYAGRAEWNEALHCYQLTLHETGPWLESSAIQAARIRRVLAVEEPPNLDDLGDSVLLHQYLLLETGERMQGTPYQAYSMLNEGKVEEAYLAAGGDQAEPHLLVLLAASTGAEPGWQKQALELPVENIQDPHLLLYLLALAHRNGQPYERYLEKFEEIYPKTHTSPLGYVKKLIEDGRPSESLEKDITGLNPDYRGLVLATAVVMYPDQAPASWRRTANCAAVRPGTPRALMFGGIPRFITESWFTES